MRSGFFKHIAYVCFLLFSSLLLLEVVVRLLGLADPLYTEGAYEASPQGEYWRYRPGFEGWVLGPTHVRIGPLGTRLHSSPDDRDRGLTVAIFGDSVTFGQGVDDDFTFAARLEQRLRKEALRTRVLNFGVQGHTAEMEIAHLSDRLTEIHPEIIVWAFVSDDLTPWRDQNHVDHFGYLTKTDFGPPSYWLDLIRAGLRRSRAALLAKDAYLRMLDSPARAQGRAGPKDSTPESKLARIRSLMGRFRSLSPEARKVVACLDMEETALTWEIRDMMRDEFPQVVYVHAPPAFFGREMKALKVPRDGHPNAAAHAIFADLLWAPVVTAARSLTTATAAERPGP